MEKHEGFLLQDEILCRARLNGYLVLNIVIPVYMIVKAYYGKEPNRKLVIALILSLERGT
jgi:hypothetical protein